MKAIQSKLLIFLDKQENVEENFQNLIKLLMESKIGEDQYQLKSLLYLLLKISNNHYRTPNFFGKIESVLSIFIKDIKKYYSNSEIFNIFKRNKRILLFLIKNNILNIDKRITTIITNKNFKDENYPQYFFNEIKPYVSKNLLRRIEKEIPSDFEEKRKIGDNDDFIAQLIQNDFIDQFKNYVLQTKIQIKTHRIATSIFETHSYLLKRQPTLLQYAAFFGSIKIFNYLFIHDCQINPSLWLFAIHGQSREIIKILEDNSIIPIDTTFEKCLKESIKCHHFEMSNFIINEKLMKQIELVNQINSFNQNINSYSFHYYNFSFLQNNYQNKFLFYYACKYDYFIIAYNLLTQKKVDNNQTIILKINCFCLY